MTFTHLFKGLPVPEEALVTQHPQFCAGTSFRKKNQLRILRPLSLSLILRGRCSLMLRVHGDYWGSCSQSSRGSLGASWGAVE